MDIFDLEDEFRIEADRNEWKAREKSIGTIAYEQYWGVYQKIAKDSGPLRSVIDFIKRGNTTGLRRLNECDALSFSLEQQFINFANNSLYYSMLCNYFSKRVIDITVRKAKKNLKIAQNN